MKHIRSALAAGLLVIGGAAVASAQQSSTAPATPQRQGQVAGQGRRAGAGRHGMGGQLLKGITLSSAEKANLKAVHAKYADQMKTIRGGAKAQKPTDAQREQMRQLMTAQRNDLRAALSPENQAKFDANATQMKAHMEKRAAKGKPTTRPPRSY